MRAISALGLFGGLVASAAAAAAAGCGTDVDCDLNGVCTGGVCVCDKPWTGSTCGEMRFKPVTFPQGYGMVSQLAVWPGLVEVDGVGSPCECEDTVLTLFLKTKKKGRAASGPACGIQDAQSRRPPSPATGTPARPAV